MNFHEVNKLANHNNLGYSLMCGVLVRLLHGEFEDLHRLVCPPKLITNGAVY